MLRVGFFLCQIDSTETLIEMVRESGEPWSVQFIIVGLLALLVVLLTGAGIVARAIWNRYVKREDILNEEKKKFAEDVRAGMKEIVEGFHKMELGFQRLELIQSEQGKDIKTHAQELNELKTAVKGNTERIKTIESKL